MNYTDRVETDWHFRVMLPIGTYVPFYCTASGKTFLASLRKSQIQSLTSSMNLKTYTSNTITDHEALIKQVKLVRKQGYAIDDEELYDDMLAIAVPVHTATGHYCGAIAIHGPKSRFSLERALSFLPDLKAASQDISKALFDD